MSLLVGHSNIDITKLQIGDMVFAVHDFRYQSLGTWDITPIDTKWYQVLRNDAFVYLGKSRRTPKRSANHNFLWVRGGVKFQNSEMLRSLLERLEYRPEWKVLGGEYDD